ncbi:unnamed protein product [Kuraishia capsulata CBS 1993]|uniref:XPG-I domain-containing protein n=1 Tax=Kuraishia capsulata CBS 1993 TaxID=1382522 RepID=W6MX41_9ASCO|nr:uncharacterized protein KUCA_T00004212001 [Kuraishia capsulata CBS 1993]CDK28230.1 unnamed protein product [Kuraishia capsulata CBS 1993]
MGVSGLWDIIDEKLGETPRRIRFTQYADECWQRTGQPTRIGVDIYQWILSWISTAEKKEVNKGESTLRMIESKTRVLIAAHVSFLFVFDGVAKEFKKRWGDSGGELNDGDYLQKYNAICGLVQTSDGDSELQQIIGNVKKMFDEMNISYVQAPGDAEIELARLNASGVLDAVITNDGDALIYGARIMLRNFSKNSKDAPYNSTGEKHFYVTILDARELETKTGFSMERLRFFRVMSGDDYFGGLEDFGQLKASQLALVGTPFFKRKDDESLPNEEDKEVDFTRMLDRIYMPESNTLMQILKCLNFPTLKKRKDDLFEFESKLRDTIQKHSAYYFGRNYSSLKFRCDDEHSISMAFLPPLANTLYLWNVNDTNYASYEPNNIQIELSRIPQGACITKHSEDSITVLRSSGQESVFRYNPQRKTYVFTDVIGGKRPHDWFAKSQIFLPTDEPKMKRIAEAYVTRAIICGDSAMVGPLHIDKKSTDTTQEPEYRVKYQPFRILGLENATTTSCWISSTRLMLCGQAGEKLTMNFQIRQSSAEEERTRKSAAKILKAPKSPTKQRKNQIDRNQRTIVEFDNIFRIKKFSGSGDYTKPVSRPLESPGSQYHPGNGPVSPDRERRDIFEQSEPNTPANQSRVRKYDFVDLTVESSDED